jgi:hypothetical protein
MRFNWNIDWYIVSASFIDLKKQLESMWLLEFWPSAVLKTNFETSFCLIENCIIWVFSKKPFYKLSSINELLILQIRGTQIQIKITNQSKKKNQKLQKTNIFECVWMSFLWKSLDRILYWFFKTDPNRTLNVLYIMNY